MIPFVDISKEFELLKNEITSKINKVLFSSQFILGEEVEIFEKNIADFLNVKHAVGVGNGTDALHIALRAAGIKQGDKVITTPFSFIATTEAILYTGATPVFVDIDPDTYNIDPEKIEEVIDEKTKAILIVHLYGNPCNMNKILELKEKYNLIVIEDATESLSSKYNGQYTGTIGDFGCFSFNGNKLIKQAVAV